MRARIRDEVPATRRPIGTHMRASGFFVVRTPLLPYEVLETLSDGLKAAALGIVEDLDGALADDRRRVLAMLRGFVERPEVDEALFVASPSFHAAVQAWIAAPESARALDVPATLLRYLTRMT